MDSSLTFFRDASRTHQLPSLPSLPLISLLFNHSQLSRHLHSRSKDPSPRHLLGIHALPPFSSASILRQRFVSSTSLFPAWTNYPLFDLVSLHRNRSCLRQVRNGRPRSSAHRVWKLEGPCRRGRHLAQGRKRCLGTRARGSLGNALH